MSLAIYGINADGIKADIQWTSPNVCTVPEGNAFSLEGMTLCNLTSCDYWVQVGWWKQQGLTDPRFYCEFHSPGRNVLQFRSLSSGAHNYKMQYDPLDSIWDCLLDDDGWFSNDQTGFSRGTFLIAQGETNATHGQIGRMAPANILFYNMKYRRRDNSTWYTMDVQSHDIDVPYGGAEVGAGTWQNWTNAH
jgi:hypothetical protein